MLVEFREVLMCYRLTGNEGQGDDVGSCGTFAPRDVRQEEVTDSGKDDCLWSGKQQVPMLKSELTRQTTSDSDGEKKAVPKSQPSSKDIHGLRNSLEVSRCDKISPRVRYDDPNQQCH